MNAPQEQSSIGLLRVAWWSAVVLIGLHLIVMPGLLDQPSTFLGSEDGSSATIRWVPVALLVWILLGVRWIRSSRPVAAVHGFARGAGAIFLMVGAVAVVLLAVKLLATVVGAALI